MSASQRVQILADKVEELSLLAEFIRNPNLISDLQEEIKKLNSLTLTEEAKLFQARKDLSEYEEKYSALQNERDQLDADKAAYEEQTAAKSAELSTLSENLDVVAKNQMQKDAEQDAREKQYLDARKEFEATFITMKNSFSDREDILSKREAKVIDDEERVAASRDDLTAAQQKFAEKLRLLQAE